MLRLSLVVAMLLSVVFEVGARGYKVEEVENVQLINRERFVSNPDAILPSDAVATLDSLSLSLKERGIAEVAIVVLKDIYPQDMLGFSQELFKGWGVGDEELDNGLGILFVEDMREIRFHTGYGLEGVLPDVLCYRIQQEYMVPYFRAGDYAKGMVEGMRAIDEVLSGGELPRASNEDEADTEAMILALMMVLVMVVLPIILILVNQYQKNKCPYCKHHTLRVVSTERMQMGQSTIIVEKLHCDHCNKDHVRRRNGDDHNDRNGGNGGRGIWLFPMGGGYRGGGFGGGGFGGGGFGGGSFGGGGSGSSW